MIFVPSVIGLLYIRLSYFVLLLVIIMNDFRQSVAAADKKIK